MPEDNPNVPATEVILQRWHFGTNGAIGHMGWSHNYPESEVHLNEFIDRTTRVDVEPDSYRLLELSSEEIFKYPFAYISEPGEMEMTEAEVANLREYIDRGGFILIDDFDTWHMDNLREEMRRVFPDRAVRAAHDRQPDLRPRVQGRGPRQHGAVRAGRRSRVLRIQERPGQIAIVALHNNDLANFWEWYGLPEYPLKPATDAFRLGTNFIVHAMTH